VDSPADEDAKNFRLDASVNFWRDFRTKFSARNLTSSTDDTKAA
jgi:hypothetical protein